jgi:hypothetical protein
MRRRRPSPPSSTPAPDPWVALLRAAPAHTAREARTVPVEPVEPAAARDRDRAIVATVRTWTDAHGNAVTVRALRRPRAGGDTDVVVSAPVPLPDGWWPGGDGGSLVCPAGLPLVNAHGASAGVLVRFEAPGERSVTVEVTAVGVLTAPPPLLASVAAWVAAADVELVLAGVAPTALAGAGASRVHVAVDARDAVALAEALAPGERPCVVVGARTGGGLVARLRATGAAVVASGAGAACSTGGAAIVPGADGRWRLDPPGWPLERLTPIPRRTPSTHQPITSAAL